MALPGYRKAWAAPSRWFEFVETLLQSIRTLTAELGRPVQFMEVCGTHTMCAFRSGLRSLLPETVKLLSGPGCPVCVTPAGFVDFAIAIARQPGTTVATFGDMVRVPGTESSLERARAGGATVRVVYSPMDALAEAEQHTDRRIVFLGIGFETTAPGVAWTIREAARRGLKNYSVLSAHKLIPPAMDALLRSGNVRVDGFLCPGHVSVIIGARAYEFVCERYRIPCVVAGFEAQDMAGAMAMLLRQLCRGECRVENEYLRTVGADGNREALAVVAEVFEPCDTAWRGLGTIQASGLRIRAAYRAHDAAEAFGGLPLPAPVEPAGCLCGEVLCGLRTPPECPLFASRCTPDTPVGSCMVSSEGTCAAHYRYGRPLKSGADKSP